MRRMPSPPRVRPVRGAAVATLPAALACALALLLALPCTVASAAPRGGEAGPRAPHPHFDDRGTLDWHATWAQASAAARRSGRLVFLDLGREACSGCRELVEQVLPSAAVRTRLARVAVGWAADADRQEPFVLALRREHLPYASMLPMMGFVTPEGRWVAGQDGRIEVREFLGLLARAEAALAAQPAPRVADAAQEAPAALPPPRVRAPAPALAPRPPAAQHAPAPAPAPALAPVRSFAPAAEAPRISGLRLRFADGALPGDRPLAEEHAPAPMLAPAPAPAPARRATPAFPLPPPMPAGVSASVALAPTSGAVARAPEPALEEALALARAGRRGEARARLEALRRQVPGTPAGREAQRGLDALGALDELVLLQQADPARAEALREARRRALGDTRWAVLF